VVAEVFSPGTKARDQGIKIDLYQSIPSVQAILFIDTKVMRVKLCQREADHWPIYTFTREDEIVALTGLDIQFAVAEIYEKTTLDGTFAAE
jgi:Uma2 family endonuclease